MKAYSGFTLIELMLVLALFLSLGALSAFFTAKVIAEYAVADTADFLTGSLREARFQSRLGKGESTWGVYADDDRIVLFQGGDYLSRDVRFDRQFLVNPNVSITGMGEILFARKSGLPSSSGTIAVTGPGVENSRTIVLNERGVVER